MSRSARATRAHRGRHLLRDLETPPKFYPDTVWPTQIADALRELIHQANLARQNNQHAIEQTVRDEMVTRLRHGVRVGLSDTTSHGNRPCERKPACYSKPCATANPTYCASPPI